MLKSENLSDSLLVSGPSFLVKQEFTDDRGIKRIINIFSDIHFSLKGNCNESHKDIDDFLFNIFNNSKNKINFFLEIDYVDFEKQNVLDDENFVKRLDGIPIVYKRFKKCFQYSKENCKFAFKEGNNQKGKFAHEGGNVIFHNSDFRHNKDLYSLSFFDQILIQMLDMMYSLKTDSTKKIKYLKVINNLFNNMKNKFLDLEYLANYVNYIMRKDGVIYNLFKDLNQEYWLYFRSKMINIFFKYFKKDELNVLKNFDFGLEMKILLYNQFKKYDVQDVKDKKLRKNQFSKYLFRSTHMDNIPHYLLNSGSYDKYLKINYIILKINSAILKYFFLYLAIIFFV